MSAFGDMHVCVDFLFFPFLFLFFFLLAVHMDDEHNNTVPGGTSCQNLGRLSSQVARTCLALELPVSSTCFSIIPLRIASPSGVETLCALTISRFTCPINSPSGNSSLVNREKKGGSVGGGLVGGGLVGEGMSVSRAEVK